MAIEHPTVDTGPNLRRQGMLILGVFALIWALMGASGLGNATAEIAVQIVAVVVTVILVVIAVQSDTAFDAMQRLPPDWNRRYNRVGLLQAGAIGVAVVALIWVGTPGLIPVAVCLIVGVHFFPLVTVFEQPEYRWTALALCLAAVLGAVLFVATNDATVRAAVGLSAAIILWLTAYLVPGRA